MVSPQGSDYLNRNMLADESDPPAYTPQPLNAHRKRPLKRFNGVSTASQDQTGRQDNVDDRPPYPPRPEQPSTPVPAFVPPPAQQTVPHRPPNLPVRTKRLVLAVDFGTTYSGERSVVHRIYKKSKLILRPGIAFTMTDAHHANLANIEVISDWTSRMSNLEKVPSVISYSHSKQGQAQWGTDISKGAVTMVNQKLELELQDSKLDELDLTLYVLKGTDYLSFENVREAGPFPEFTFKTPEEVVTDYLKHLFKCARDAINEEQISRTNTAIDMVVTVPVVSLLQHSATCLCTLNVLQPWTYHGFNSIFKAISKAGFNTTNLPTLKDIMMVSEPEAAALFTAQDLKDRGTEFLQVKLDRIT